MAKKAARQPVKKTKAKPAPRSATGAATKAVRGARAAAPKSAGKAAGKAAVAKKVRVPAKPATMSIGRPLVTAEEKLYLLFKEDYHARQIFEFLRVGTVGELEQFSPQQIIELLSMPVRTTVERIRQKLAENKRSLRGDDAFAKAHLAASKLAALPDGRR